MSAPLAPLTELEAVNLMLSVLGESPISTLEENQVIEASLALRLLRSEAVTLQNKGWAFNTEEAYVLTPDVKGFITLPRNTLKCDTSGEDLGLDLVVRGQRLYNRSTHSYVIGRDVTVTIVFALPYEELPSTARTYVATRATRIFQDRYGGDDALHVYTKDDEKAAHALLIEDEIETADPNMLRDNQGTQQILRRTY